MFEYCIKRRVVFIIKPTFIDIDRVAKLIEAQVCISYQNHDRHFEEFIYNLREIRRDDLYYYSYI